MRNRLVLLQSSAAAAGILLRQTRLETKLLLRLRWPLLLPLAAGVWMLIQLSGYSPGLSQNLYRHLIESQSAFHTLVLGLPLLLGILLVRRDVLNPAYEWIHALPVSNLTFLLSKLAAGLLYMATVALCVDAVYAVQALRADVPVADALSQLRRLNLDYLTAYGISLALGLTLGTQLPSRFALPVGFCAWMFGSVFLQLVVVDRNGWYLFKAFYLNHLLTPGPVWNELWGDDLAGAEYVWLRLFVAVFGLFLLVWSAARLGNDRPFGLPGKALAAAVLAFLAACAAFVPYAQLWNARYAHLAALREAAPDVGALRPQERYAFRVDSLKLELRRLPDDSFSAAAELTLPTANGKPLPAGSAAEQWTPAEDGMLTFLLYPSLTVTKVTSGGKPADFTRDGDRLSVPLESLDPGPEASRQIRIEYEGSLNEWNYTYGKEVYIAFLRGQSVYLPAHAGWYPLPGGDGLLFREDGTLKDRLDAADSFRADVEVRLVGFEGPLYATLPETDSATVFGGERRFTAHDAPAFSLIGGSGLIEVRRQGETVSVVTAAANRAAADAFLEELSARRQYYEGWLGPAAGGLSRVFYLPDDLTQTRPERGARSRQAGSALLLTESMHEPLGSSQLNRAMMMLLFGDDNERSQFGASRPASLVQEIRQTIVSMYERERTEAGAFSAPDNGQAVPLSPGASQQEKIDASIREAAEAGKLDGVKLALRAFYERGLQVRMPYRSDVYEEKASGIGSYPVIGWEDWYNAMPEAAGG